MVGKEVPQILFLFTTISVIFSLEVGGTSKEKIAFVIVYTFLDDFEGNRV